MTKYRIKTEQEFKDSGDWAYYGSPRRWNEEKRMNYLLGQPVDDEHIGAIERGCSFSVSRNDGRGTWNIRPDEVVLNASQSIDGFVIQKVEEINI